MWEATLRGMLFSYGTLRRGVHLLENSVYTLVRAETSLNYVE